MQNKEDEGVEATFMQGEFTICVEEATMVLSLRGTPHISVMLEVTPSFLQSMETLARLTENCLILDEIDKSNCPGGVQ